MVDKPLLVLQVMRHGDKYVYLRERERVREKESESERERSLPEMRRDFSHYQRERDDSIIKSRVIKLTSSIRMRVH